MKVAVQAWRREPADHRAAVRIDLRCVGTGSGAIGAGCDGLARLVPPRPSPPYRPPPWRQLLQPAYSPSAAGHYEIQFFGIGAQALDFVVGRFQMDVWESTPHRL